MSYLFELSYIYVKPTTVIVRSEFPLDWMRRHLTQAQFSVTSSKNFTILHSEESAVRQIRVGQSKISLMDNTDLRTGMEKYMNDLE